MGKEWTMDSYNNGQSLYDFVKEQLENVDTSKIENEYEEDEVKVEVTPGKVYFWTRVYLKDENPNIEIGDVITLKYTPSGEELKTQFFAWGKKGLERDNEDQITSYDSEDDKKVVCLMVDEKEVNESEKIPFIRTLFKLGRHYEYQLVKRDELQFIVDRNGIMLDYFDCEF